MFALDRSLKKIDARPADIVTLLVSTNRPMVAVSGPAQQADAFIVSVARGKTQPVYLCFHVINDGERLIYTSNAVPTSESARTKLEEEALRFAEDMGFMMVRERFDELSPTQRDDTIMGLAPFVDDITNIRHDEKPDKRQRKDSVKQALESEIEYDEVYEEVEEEVPVEEEAPTKEEPPGPEEYESLADVVSEVSSQEAAASAGADVPATRQEEAPPTAVEPAGAAEASFDLGQELSDVVQTIKDIPERRRSAQKAVAVQPRPAKPTLVRASRPEPSPERPGQPEPAPGAPTGNVSDRRQAVIKLLISL